MAGLFSATVSAGNRQSRVNYTWLVEMQFLSGAAYFAAGTGRLVAGGKTWLGVAGLGKIEGLQDAVGFQNANVNITLSGHIISSDMVQKAIATPRSDYYKRPLIIWLQFFDLAWNQTDNPYAFRAALMDGISIDRAEGPQGTYIRSVTVEAEDIFYNRWVASDGYWTDSDQKDRYPGDRGLENIPSLLNKNISVPW